MEEISKPLLYVITGPMFSGKSLELIRIRGTYLVKYEPFEVPFFLLKRAQRDDIENNDTRAFGGSRVEDKILIDDDTDFETMSVQSRWKAIFVDEAHFFYDHFVSFIQRCLDQNLHIYVSGLNGSSECRPMGCMSELIALSTTICKFNGVCSFCTELNAAPYSVYIHEKKTDEVLIGSCMYAAACWKCKRKHEKKNKE